MFLILKNFWQEASYLLPDTPPFPKEMVPKRIFVKGPSVLKRIFCLNVFGRPKNKYPKHLKQQI